MASLNLFFIRSLSSSRTIEVAKIIASGDPLKVTNFEGKEEEKAPADFYSNVPYLDKKSIIVKTWSGACREGLLSALEQANVMNIQRSDYYEGTPRRDIRNRVFLLIKLPIPPRFRDMDIVSEVKSFCMEVYKKFKSEDPELYRVEGDRIWRCCQVVKVESNLRPGRQPIQNLNIVFPIRSRSNLTLFIFHSIFVMLLRSWIFLDDKGKRRSLSSIYSFWGDKVKERREGTFAPLNIHINFIMYCIFLFGHPSTMFLSQVVSYRGRTTGPIDYFKTYPQVLMKLCEVHKIWHRFHKYDPRIKDFPSKFLTRYVDTKRESHKSKEIKISKRSVYENHLS